MDKLLILLLFIFVSCNTKSAKQEGTVAHTEKIEKDTFLKANLEDEDYDNFLVGIEELNFSIENESRFINADSFKIRMHPENNYKLVKQKIINKREGFKNQFLLAQSSVEKQKIINSASKYLSESLLNKIIPFWYGMPWDLAGYSDIPNSGEVGCSYFVSNTLKHCGFKLNRYKLAQQNTKNIALSIQLCDSILIIKSNDDISTLKKYFLQYKNEGLYYVGLDSHVGYLLFRMDELFFIQSNYSSPSVVLTEYCEKSDVFLSGRYYIADISENKELTKKWILGKEIDIVTD